MYVYLVTVTEITLPVRSFVAGVYATRSLADSEAARICKEMPDEVVTTVTETEVIGAQNSWEGQVDRQGGSFDDREIVDHYGWR
jgi:hypothetical protein